MTALVQFEYDASFHGPYHTLPFESSEPKSFEKEIMKLQDKKVVEELLHSKGKFILPSCGFLLKKNKAYRIILKLRKLNESVMYFHFKMESIIQCYCTSCYIKITLYYLMPIASKSKFFEKHLVGKASYISLHAFQMD